MNEALVISLARDALWTALKIASPMLGVALAVGVLVSIVQVATSIQDQTLSFVPKILAVLAALLIFMNWIIQTLVAYTAGVIMKITLIAP